MIVRDEERDLPRCLASIAGLADELVVVDTGSVDRTRELVAAAGARVIEIEWPHDFSIARNVAIEAATHDWILVLDADEEIMGPLREELAQADQLGLHGVSLVMRNLSPPGDATTYEDFPVVRLFRRLPHIRYEGRIHEQISPSITRNGGTIGSSDLYFLHHGYQSLLAQGVNRAQRNLVLLEAASRAAPGDAYLHYQLGVTQKAVGDAAAEASLERALGLAGLSPSAEANARMKLAQLALARGADGKAFAEAQRCLAIDPINVVALQVTIVSAIALEKFPAAANACRALLACSNVAASARADATQLLGLLDAR